MINKLLLGGNILKLKTNLSRTQLVISILALLCFSLTACTKSDKTGSTMATPDTSNIETPETSTTDASDSSTSETSVSNTIETAESSTIETSDSNSVPTSDISTMETSDVSTIATSDSNTEDNDLNSISIKYVGNSCFYITFSDGTRLVTDPYGSSNATSFGTFPELEADVITISHNHSDHTSTNEVIGDPKIISADDLNEVIKVGNVEITGYASKHVAGMGDNTIFVYNVDGFKIVHMGETDNIDSKEAQEAVKDADVILAYAGEYGVVKNKDSFKTLDELNIKVIIPQHYSMVSSWYGEPTIDDILLDVPEGFKVTKTNEFIVTKDLEKQFVAISHMEN